MFIGHYAPALLAKTIKPNAPLWLYLLAAQTLDIAWCSFIIVGIERCHLDKNLPGAPLSLDFMPYSHSLPAAIIWSIAGFITCRWMFKLSASTSMCVAAIVFSHWLLDLLVHRPDLAIWSEGFKVGLSMWNSPVLEETVEVSLLGICGAIWISWFSKTHQKTKLALFFLAELFGFQILEKVLPLPPSPAAVALSTLTIYLLIAASGRLCEERDENSWTMSK